MKGKKTKKKFINHIQILFFVFQIMYNLLPREMNKYFQNTSKSKMMLGSEKQYFLLYYIKHFFISFNTDFIVILNIHPSLNFCDISRNLLNEM